MNHTDFLNQLALHPEHEVLFECGGTPVRRGYHLTEVLRAQVDAIDCGGSQAQWTEAVLQLVASAAEPEPRAMRASKLWAILQRAHAAIPQAPDSPVLLEFRGAAEPAAQRFHVTRVLTSAPGVLTVQSTGSATQCKAAQSRPAACGTASACCAPLAS